MVEHHRSKDRWTTETKNLYSNCSSVLCMLRFLSTFALCHVMKKWKMFDFYAPRCMYCNAKQAVHTFCSAETRRSKWEIDGVDEVTARRRRLIQKTRRRKVGTTVELRVCCLRLPLSTTLVTQSHSQTLTLQETRMYRASPSTARIPFLHHRKRKQNCRLASGLNRRVGLLINNAKMQLRVMVFANTWLLLRLCNEVRLCGFLNLLQN